MMKQKKIWVILLLCLAVLFAGCQDKTDIPDSPSTLECTHIDADSNMLCDLCQISVIVNFDLYNINDLHGKVADGENHPGVDELTTYLNNAKEQEEHTIILSSGDMWQGSSESNLTHGALTTEWMNDVGFAAMTLGNHEYDWGEASIENNAELAEFPFLAINIYDRTTNEQVDYCQSSTIVDLGDIQVGIVGAMGDCYSSIAADKTEEIYFKVGQELTELVKAECDDLRAQGVDYIVYVIHDGYGQSLSSAVSNVKSSQLRSYYDVALSDGYVDLVFEGHTHQRYVLKDIYGVYHLQNKGDNKGISHVTVSYNLATRESSVKKTDLVVTGKYANLEDDHIVADLMEKYNDIIAPALEVVGTNAVIRQSNEMRQLIADLYYETGMKTWGDKYDIALGGGFISVRSPWTLAAGEVTYGMLQSLFPFDNDLVLCSVKGTELKSKFFETDHDSYFIAYGDYGKQIKNNINPNETYYIIVDTYTASYAPNKLTVVEEYEKGVYARDLIAEFMKQGGWR